MVLADHEDSIVITAMLFSVLNMFSGILICLDIYKQGTAEGADPIPFVGSIGFGLLLLELASILKDESIEYLIIFGIIMDISYVVFFYIYTPNKEALLYTVAKMLAIVIALLIYARLEDPFTLEFRWGVIVNIAYFLLVVSPFFNLRYIYRTKTSGILPFPIILIGAPASFLWLFYGIIHNDGIMIIQNCIVLAIRGLQLWCLGHYPKRDKKLDKSNQEESSKPTEVKKLDIPSQEEPSEVNEKEKLDIPSQEEPSEVNEKEKLDKSNQEEPSEVNEKEKLDKSNQEEPSEVNEKEKLDKSNQEEPSEVNEKEKLDKSNQEEPSEVNEKEKLDKSNQEEPSEL
ncbi:sugar transporter SWEET1-like [Aphidius gifuensis]|uniref:sugar transporter SWEET1-like n=1 Tax=Aphidius gifuensis TaxID=684658 RepID=UPI001CDBB03F|nr:sugar transporter SWEET1-like [Aphidius gifuensis]